jgi:hypothetical protein
MDEIFQIIKEDEKLSSPLIIDSSITLSPWHISCSNLVRRELPADKNKNTYVVVIRVNTHFDYPVSNYWTVDFNVSKLDWILQYKPSFYQKTYTYPELEALCHLVDKTLVTYYKLKAFI